MACNCSSSTCGSISAGLTCTYDFYQGGDYIVDIILLGTDGLPLDITAYTDILLNLYDVQDTKVAYYHYVNDVDENPIDIAQGGVDPDFTDKGMMEIKVKGSLTSTLLVGDLTCEIILQQPDGRFDNSVKVTVIPCLKLGTIKYVRNGH